MSLLVQKGEKPRTTGVSFRRDRSSRRREPIFSDASKTSTTSSMHCPLPSNSRSSKVIKYALHAPPFHALKRCRLLVIHPPHPPQYSSFAELREEMLARRSRHSRDYITSNQSHSLKASLLRFLPLSIAAATEDRQLRRQDDYEPGALEPMHHLVHFPNRALYRLLPDGTDYLHSPGAPFSRSMWAGGNVALMQDIPMDGHAFHCTESIDDVYTHGKEGEEKIYVRIKREIYAGRYPGQLRPRRVKDGLNRKAYIVEGRKLVFMRKHNPDQDAIKPPLGVSMPKGKPDFSHTIIPTRDLLFRFSALTFNAHAIHLDKAYCREVEGHRNLLVQGNLMVVLVVEVLRSYLRSGHARGHGRASSSKDPPKEPEKVISLQYQNLRPLYVDEEMKICVRKIRSSETPGITHWEVWIEGPDGGFSFRGRLNTLNKSSVASRPAEDDLGNVHQESDLYEETLPDEEIVPNEHIAFQKEANAGLEDYVNENTPEEEKTG